MKHKHAELIKAWADGATIEKKEILCKFTYNEEPRVVETKWVEELNPMWVLNEEYRIKPREDWTEERTLFWNKAVQFIEYATIRKEWLKDGNHYQPLGNFVITFDGETGKLKSAEVIK
jgi:hypothetical protein